MVGAGAQQLMLAVSCCQPVSLYAKIAFYGFAKSKSPAAVDFRNAHILTSSMVYVFGLNVEVWIKVQNFVTTPMIKQLFY